VAAVSDRIEYFIIFYVRKSLCKQCVSLDIYSAPVGERSIVMSVPVCLSVSLSLCVCLSAIISSELHTRSTPYFRAC